MGSFARDSTMPIAVRAWANMFRPHAPELSLARIWHITSRLQAKLTAANYHGELLDVRSITRGKAAALLPPLKYILCSMSERVYKYANSIGALKRGQLSTEEGIVTAAIKTLETLQGYTAGMDCATFFQPCPPNGSHALKKLELVDAFFDLCALRHNQSLPAAGPGRGNSWLQELDTERLFELITEGLHIMKSRQVPVPVAH